MDDTNMIFDDEKTVLKKSPGRGLGCYAKRNIKKYEIACTFSGILSTEKFYTKKYKRILKHIAQGKKDYADPAKYAIDVDMDHITGILDPTSHHGIIQRHQSHAWYANEPGKNDSLNGEIAQNFGTYDLVILAIKDIKKGEEILVYYGDRYERDYDICKLSVY